MTPLGDGMASLMVAVSGESARGAPAFDAEGRLVATLAPLSAPPRRVGAVAIAEPRAAFGVEVLAPLVGASSQSGGGTLSAGEIAKKFRARIVAVRCADMTVVEFHRPRILVFDSGLGGLTVYAEIAKARPDVEIVYAADDARFPYGALDEAELIGRVEKVVGELIVATAPDLVVIACNTASTLVLSRCGKNIRRSNSSARCRRSSRPRKIRARASFRC